MGEDHLWRNPRIRAFNKLISVVGDIELAELSTDHMLDFRGWQFEQIEMGQIIESSANKDFTHLGSVIRKVIKMKGLGISPPLSGWAFKEKDRNTRQPFSKEWIKTHFIDSDMLMGMNGEARGILQCMINTGGRLSEIASLRSEDISLDTSVPFIHIRPQDNGEDKREIKNRNSVRKIPLAGISLEAMKRNPGGFPRYWDKPTVSATINGFLRKNGMLETDSHTVYGLRHSFEDRMLEAGVDERVRRDFLGHSLTRERYGEGGTMEFRLAQVKRVAL